MNNKLVSVIVPVYNVEQYLAECLDSILASTYQNLEIIIVDDGSPDRCPEICDEYAQKDSRLRVIHQDNRGLSSARNAGLQIATGEFIAFVDSDDIISPIMYEELVGVIQKENADLVACESTRHINELDVEGGDPDNKVYLVTGLESCLEIITNSPTSRRFTWTSCLVGNKLFRRELISSQFRDDAVPAEDLLFCWDYVKNCERMAIVQRAMYYWRKNPTSITNTFTLDKLVSQSRIWMKIANNSQEIGFSLSRHLKFSAAYRAHYTLWKIVQANKESEYSDYVNIAKTTVYKYFTELIHHNDIECKVLITVYLFRFCNPVWRLLAKIII